jgi:hypothetical protein
LACDLLFVRPRFRVDLVFDLVFVVPESRIVYPSGPKGCIMSGFKKPSVVVRDAKVAVREKLGLSVPADPRRGYTDRMEFVSVGTLIGYKDHPGSTYPTPAMKAAVVAGANLARKVIRKANDELAAVVMLRRKESALFQSVMNTHFGLIAGDTSGGYLANNVVDKKFSLKAVFEKDRRWVLEKIREKMLSLSFHLNTGVYLIDVDASRRDLRSGAVTNPAAANPNEEAYVTYEKGTTDPNTWRTTSWKGMATDAFSGFKNGEIHISLQKLQPYSALSYARVIIHEAAHKYLGVVDNAYAHQAAYSTLSLVDCLNNADSIAWAAVSLYSGAVKMASTAAYHPDWENCA